MDLLYPPRCPFCGVIHTSHTKRQRKREENHKSCYGQTAQSAGRTSGIAICPACKEKLPYITEPRCMKCGKPLMEEEQEYCVDCERHGLAFEQGRGLWTHTGVVPKAIYRFKFHNRRYYADVFAQEMEEHYGKWLCEKGIEVIIPVPLHASKRRSRGFNQAELLARKLGKLTGISVETDAVVRVKKTSPQKKLSYKERQDNLKGAFGVQKAWNPSESVLLIDDIYTTGNTMHRIAKILKKVGVQKVYFLTISIGQGL